MSFREDGFWGYKVGAIMSHRVFTELDDHDNEVSSIDLFVWFVGADRPHMVRLSYFWLIPDAHIATYLEAYNLWGVDEAREWGQKHNWKFYP